MGIEISLTPPHPLPKLLVLPEAKDKSLSLLEIKAEKLCLWAAAVEAPACSSKEQCGFPPPPQPWKAALASSLPSSAGTFLGKTCKVKQHARTSPVRREAGRTHLPKQRHTTRCQGKTQANQQGSADPVKRHVWVRASPLDLATPQLHQGCLNAPREPQAVPVPFQVQPLIEVSMKTPSKWVRVWLSQGILRSSSESVSEKSHENI